MTSLSFDVAFPDDNRDHGRLPVEVRRSNLTLVATSVVGSSVDLEPGEYRVASRLPSGQQLSAVVSLGSEHTAVVLKPDDEDDDEPAADEPLQLEAMGAAPNGLSLHFTAGNVLSGDLETLETLDEVTPTEEGLPFFAGEARPVYLALWQSGARERTRAVPVNAGSSVRIRFVRSGGA
jgi:hypothetical protein